VRAAVLKAVACIASGVSDAGRVRREALKTLARSPKARVDYFEIVDARTLRNVVKLKARSETLVAAAVYFGRTRLIDNATFKR
jgi:pantothenate synthetase